MGKLKGQPKAPKAPRLPRQMECQNPGIRLGEGNPAVTLILDRCFRRVSRIRSTIVATMTNLPGNAHDGTAAESQRTGPRGIGEGLYFVGSLDHSWHQGWAEEKSPSGYEVPMEAIKRRYQRDRVFEDEMAK